MPVYIERHNCWKLMQQIYDAGTREELVLWASSTPRNMATPWGGGKCRSQMGVHFEEGIPSFLTIGMHPREIGFKQ
jgi:hypothetical protein